MIARRLALLGCGFWARFQLSAWLELEDVQVVALYNRTRAKAEALAAHFGIPAVYDDAEQLLRHERPDAVDIVTDAATRFHFAELAASSGVEAIYQKPMEVTLEEAEHMVTRCAATGVPLIIYENRRWQGLLHRLGQETPHWCHRSSFPRVPVVFQQLLPFLRELGQFILRDASCYLLDTARFLFGEAPRLSCQICRVSAHIKREEVATTVMPQIGVLTCLCELSYASRLEHERFPEAYVLIEGSEGALDLGPDYWVRYTRAEEMLARHSDESAVKIRSFW